MNENRSNLSFGMARQLEIYRQRTTGDSAAFPVSYEEWRERASRVLSKEAYDYVDGGAGSGQTVVSNDEALKRRRIVPRILRDVEVRDLSCELLGMRLPAPMMLAPIGVQGIVHLEAEVAVARAAASLGVPIVLSTVSSKTIEEVAVAMGSVPRWFQLYWGRDPELTASFLSRAERSGYSGLVVTLDTPLLGWRERDLRNAFLPFLQAHGLANYFSDEVFRSRLEQTPEEDPQAAVELFASVFSNPSLTWDDLDFLREHTRMPILLKGLLSANDAVQAADRGVDGLIVSNHGGRQVDGAIAALDALPEVVSRVGDRLHILFDSGIRRGADVFKAVALGAEAVLIGRPYAFGLAVGGEAGVREVLLNLVADFDLTLGLAGCRSIEEIGERHLSRH